MKVLLITVGTMNDKDILATICAFHICFFI